MRRRQVLAALAAGSLAGCLGTPRAESGSRDAEIPSLAELGFPGEVCDAERDGSNIEAIETPAFASDWQGIEVDDRYTRDGGVGEEWTVIGLERDGEARAYPISVLWFHEIVNEEFGEPLLVTYCQVCQSAMVSRREVDGEPTVFEVSGELWTPPEEHTRASEESNRTFGVDERGGEEREVFNSSNLVLVDRRTESYWSQLLARAICGPMEGDGFDIVDAEVATWGEWRSDHPDTAVLLPPPYSETV